MLLSWSESTNLISNIWYLICGTSRYIFFLIKWKDVFFYSCKMNGYEIKMVYFIICIKILYWKDAQRLLQKCK